MQITLGQQYNVGEKLVVVWAIFVSRFSLGIENESADAGRSNSSHETNFSFFKA